MCERRSSTTFRFDGFAPASWAQRDPAPARLMTDHARDSRGERPAPDRSSSGGSPATMTDTVSRNQTETVARANWRGHVAIARVDHWFKNVFVFPGIVVALGTDPYID